jgi:Ca2+-binding RTX toxin-like protein
MPAVTNAQLIAGFYAAIFNRAPDPSGLAYWEDQFSGTSSSIYTLAAGFTAHPVFTTTYGAMANQLFVETIYQNILGAGGDAEGISYWTAKLDGGEGRSTLLADFVHDALTVDVSQFTNLTQSERDVAQARQDALTNKADVGLNFAASLGAAGNLDPTTDTTTQTGLESDTAYLASQAAIANVTSDPTSVTMANTAITTALQTSEPTQALVTPFTVTLTDAVVSFANGVGEIAMTVVDGIATFVRDHATATLSVGDLPNQTINLATDQTLAVNAADAHLLNSDTIAGTGTVNIVGATTILEIGALATTWTTGTVNYSLLNGVVDTTTTGIGTITITVGNLASIKSILQLVIDHAANHSDITLDMTYVLTPGSTSLTDYNLAVAAIGSDLHGTVGYSADTSAVDVGLADYADTASANYIAALQAATHGISVTVSGDNVEDGFYTAPSTLVNNGNVTFNLVDGAIGIDLSATTTTHGFTVDASTDDSSVTITGSDHDDILTGGNGNDTLTGGLGNDTFNVNAPERLLLRNIPHDTITDLTATDTLNVAEGATAIVTGVLNFTGFQVNNLGTVNITGTVGDDVIVGTTGHDVIDGNGGNDTLTGNGGGDDFYVETGRSIITDLNADDTLTVASGALAGVSTLFDLSQADNQGAIGILGTAGGDTIVGSTTGADLISGGLGNDTMTGNGGNNAFYFKSGESNTFTFAAQSAGSTIADGSTFSFAGGTDRITDFNTSTDLLNIGGVALSNADYVNNASTTFAAPGGSGQVVLVHGNYNNDVFTAQESGADTLAIYDNAAGSTHIEAVVLTGVSQLLQSLG